MDPINEFVQTLMKEAGLSGLSDDLRLGLERQLQVLAYRRIGEVILDELGEAEQIAFMQIVDRNPETPDYDAINHFLAQHTKGLDIKLREALRKLGTLFLEQMSLAKRV